MRKRIQKTKLQKRAEKKCMSALERRELRDRIISYMEYHPLPKKQEAVRQKQSVVSEPFIYISFKSMQVRAAFGMLLLLVVIGVPIAAERSVPGDTLYPVKVSFNEEVREQLSSSGYERVAWETERIERRVAEAQLLAREGKLTEATEASIGEDIRLYTKAAQEELKTLRENNMDEAAIAEVALTSALDVQSLVLNSEVIAESERSSSTRASVKGLAETVRQMLSDVSADLSTSSSTPSYAGFIARVESETTRARELFQTIEDSTSEVTRGEIERRLEDAERAIAEAQELHNQGDEKRAIDALRHALANTQKLIAFMTNIDLRTAVTLEQLIPKKLTNDERLAAINSSIEDIRAIERDVRSRVETMEDPELIEKIEIGLADLATLLELSATSTENSGRPQDIKRTEEALVEAHALATDLDILTGFVSSITGTSTATDTPSTSNGTTTVTEDTATSTEDDGGEGRTNATSTEERATGTPAE